MAATHTAAIYTDELGDYVWCSCGGGLREDDSRTPAEVEAHHLAADRFSDGYHHASTGLRRQMRDVDYEQGYRRGLEAWSAWQRT